ncbi:1-aminocyclopropane-1-carboxylate synthase 8 [Quercus suber]|uniref:1-aminocyclopropane-1-carboxylate synthase 8 n=1 Tax=Quercus suber TaxID=58331 RepID=A0AAW0LPE3_QUESU
MLFSDLSGAGIECLKSNACLFCWVDMRDLLSSDTFEAEKELSKRILFEVGLNTFLGLLAIVLSLETLKVAITRIKDFVESITSSRENCNHQLTVRDSRRRSVSKWVVPLSPYDNNEPADR